MIDNDKKIITIGIIVFVIILTIAIVAGVSLNNISSDVYKANLNNQAATEETEKAAAEKAAAEKAAAEKAAAEKAAAEKAAAEKAAAEKAAAEKAEKERLENLPAGFVSGYYNYDISNDLHTFDFTFQQTQNVKYITIHLLNFAGNRVYAENFSGTLSNEFKIVPNGVTAQLALYNTTDTIESVEIIVTYNNGRTDTYYDSFGLG